jgi:hypothetical protein
MTLGKWSLLALAVGLLFWFPLTRAAILFILPLGSGIDDLIAVFSFVVAAALYALYKRGTISTGYSSKARWTFAIILGTTIVAALIIWSMTI